MSRHVVRFNMRPPTRIDRLWYRQLRINPPDLASGTVGGPWIRLLPQNWTWIHRRHAHRHGLFWLPCILCQRYYGGHQYAGSIPDPTRGPGCAIGICPHCTRNGRGWHARHPIEDTLDNLAEQHGHGHDDWHADCLRCVAHHLAIRDAIQQHPEETP